MNEDTKTMTSALPAALTARPNYDWWPMCAVCGKPVSNLVSIVEPDNPPVRKYVVACHGETETALVGIWAAFEIAQAQKRLPVAFKRK